jgi:hypothetical protein
MLVRDFNRHWEYVHAKHEYDHNPHALKCHSCKMGFVSKRLFTHHLIRRMRHSGTHISQNGDFKHYRRLKEEDLIWTTPQQYIRIDETVGKNQVLNFPTRGALRNAFKDRKGGHNLIFFYRSSSERGNSLYSKAS